MESLGPIALAGMIAGLLTYFDLDTVFDVPPQALPWRPWLSLLAWWWGFVLANAALAGLLYYVLRETYFKDVTPWLGALLAGAGYPALVRLQFTTLRINDKNTPLGIETFYEMLKLFVHKRINRIIRESRIAESQSLVQLEIAPLRERALLMVGCDALLSGEKRTSDSKWINDTANDVATPEADRRRTLVLYIITGQRGSQP